MDLTPDERKILRKVAEAKKPVPLATFLPARSLAIPKFNTACESLLESLKRLEQRSLIARHPGEPVAFTVTEAGGIVHARLVVLGEGTEDPIPATTAQESKDEATT